MEGMEGQSRRRIETKCMFINHRFILSKLFSCKILVP